MEQKLTDDYLESLVTAKADNAVADKVAEFDSLRHLETDVKSLATSVSLIEKSEITRSQTFTHQIKGLQQALSQKHNELPVKIDVLESFI
jgi:hypothetical protein